MIINKIKKQTPTIIGTDLKAFIKLSEVDHDVALLGLEKFIATCSPLAPNIRNKTPNKKNTIGIPNNFMFLFSTTTRTFRFNSTVLGYKITQQSCSVSLVHFFIIATSYFNISIEDPLKNYEI